MWERPGLDRGSYPFTFPSSLFTLRTLLSAPTCRLGSVLSEAGQSPEQPFCRLLSGPPTPSVQHLPVSPETSEMKRPSPYPTMQPGLGGGVQICSK